MTKERIITEHLLEDAKACLQNATEKELLDSATGLAEIFRLQLELSNSGETILTKLFEGIDNFASYDHLPSPDVYDEETGFQYYYHAHFTEEREEKEHGHFHLFYDLRKHPEADRLIPADMSRDKRVLTHLIAFSMSERGEIMRVFTVNGWVADDVPLPAEETLNILSSFRVASDKRFPQLNSYLESLSVAFRQLIQLLVLKRELAITEKVRSSGRTLQEVLDDKSFEVPSSIFLSLADWALALDEEADKRGVSLLDDFAA